MVNISDLAKRPELLAKDYISGKLSYQEAYNCICQVLQDLRDLVGKVPFYKKRQLYNAIEDCNDWLDDVNHFASSTTPFYTELRFLSQLRQAEISRGSILGPMFHTPCFETGRGCTCCTVFCQIPDLFDPVYAIPTEANSEVYLFQVQAALDTEERRISVTTTGDLSVKAVRALFNKVENLRWKDILL